MLAHRELSLLAAAFLQVATHWVLLWLGGRAFPQHLSLACMLLSSTALVGGPATAAGGACVLDMCVNASAYFVFCLHETLAMGLYACQHKGIMCC
jgi:hypothetical protein